MNYIHELPSTQDFLKIKGQDFPHGTVCLCDLQIKGRGRGENVWTSPPGCLTFTMKSVIENLGDGVKLPLIQYLACLAVVKGIADQTSTNASMNFAPRIKWPNDIYAIVQESEDGPKTNVKIGGILSESVTKGGKYEVFVGIGLNIDNALPTVCVNDMINTEVEGNERIQREKLLASILVHYEKLMAELFQGRGFEAMKEDYLASWLHNEQEVVLNDSKHKDLKVKIKNISSSTGALIAEDEKGERYELYPDGNTFDFFEGLISRKL